MKDPSYLTKALKQIDQAARNLSSSSAEGEGSDTRREVSRRASELLSKLASAIRFGSTYRLRTLAAAFDEANLAHTKYLESE